MKKRVNIDSIINRIKMFSALPTDNFYKFGFVASLVLFVFFVSTLNGKVEKQKEYSFQLDLRSTEFDIKYESLTTKLKLVTEVFKSVPDSGTGLEWSKRLDSLEMSKEVLDREKKIHNLSIADFNKKSETLSFDKCLYGILIFLSVSGSVTFGILWYRKVQRFEDKILKRNAN